MPNLGRWSRFPGFRNSHAPRLVRSICRSLEECHRFHRLFKVQPRGLRLTSPVQSITAAPIEKALLTFTLFTLCDSIDEKVLALCNNVEPVGIASRVFFEARESLRVQSRNGNDEADAFVLQ